MQNSSRNTWRALPALFMLLYIVPPKAFSTAEQGPTPDQKILETISAAHALPAEQTILQDHPSLQDQALNQEPQELDPTKPATFLFDPLIDNGLLEKDNAKKPANSLSLTAIFIAKGRKIAVINGTILKEGEIIAGKEIKEITNDTVKLIEKQGLLELKLPSFSLKKEAS